MRVPHALINSTGPRQPWARYIIGRGYPIVTSRIVFLMNEGSSKACKGRYTNYLRHARGLKYVERAIPKLYYARDRGVVHTGV